MSIKGTEFARLMGVTPARVSQWRAEGMPTTGIQEAAAWVETKYGRSGGIPKFTSTDSNAGKKTSKPTKKQLVDQGIDGTYARARQMEMDAFVLYQDGERNALTNTEMISRMRRWEIATGIRIKAEKQITELAVRNKTLVPLDEARSLFDELALPLDKMLRTMPSTLSHMCNPSDPEHAEAILTDWVNNALAALTDNPEPLED